MAEKFFIKGGKPLAGEIEARGAKNAAFPVLAAVLLTEEECSIENLPLIEDVFRMIEILKDAGAEIFWTDKRDIKIRTKNFDPAKIRADLVAMFRGSVLLIGPLLARFKRIEITKPGGCLIGVRSIETHLDGFRQLGVEVSQKDSNFEFILPGKLKSCEVVLNELSVTATENLLLFASLMPGKITIRMADADYQIQELIKFLRKMGADIKLVDSHTFVVAGSKKLRGARHRLMYDPIEAGTFILCAGAARGKVLVKNVETLYLALFLKKLSDAGFCYRKIGPNQIRVLPWKKINLGKIQSMPYPGLPTDLLSAFGVLATQVEGDTFIHDPLYEGRLKYFKELNKMGAKIDFLDPHRAIVHGPTRLVGKKLKSYDLRGGMSFVIAGLIARGLTVIDNVYQIDRGYEKIEERLQGIGADIKRIKP